MTATLSTPFTTPIGGTPVAEGDLTYRENYRRLADEVEKARALGSAATNWSYVLSEGTRVLQDEAKDLRAASWVVVAKAHVDGWNGAAEGLGALGNLVEGFWDVMLPSRPRTRVTQIDWLWEGLARALRGRTPAAHERAAIAELLDVAERVNALLVERTKQGSDGAGGFRKLVREALADLPADLPRVPAAPAPPAPSALPADVAVVAAVPLPTAPIPVPSIEAPAVAAPVSLDEADRIASRLRDPVAALARYLRELAPHTPAAYRLARVSAWFTVEELPYVERGRTELRAPAASDRELLARFARESAWADLRDASEAALGEHPFWLDVHRYTSVALDNLGPPFASARATVGRELVGLLERAAGLESLVFSNGTPLADPETRGWIDRERQRHRGGGAGGTVSAGADEDFDKLVEAARARMGEGGETALAEVLAAAQTQRTVPARFLAICAAAKLALDAGKRDAARALYGRLYSQVDRTLEAWQPDVCRRYFEGYLEALRGGGDDPPQGRRQAAVFSRLLALDPALALRYEGGKK